MQDATQGRKPLPGKNPKSGLANVISATAGVSVLFLTSILLEMPLEWRIGLWLVSMIATVWMAIRILKDPYSTDKTFDEYFYQDRDDLRPTRVVPTDRGDE